MILFKVSKEISYEITLAPFHNVFEFWFHANYSKVVPVILNIDFQLTNIVMFVIQLVR